jgi:hypothetical protein
VLIQAAQASKTSATLAGRSNVAIRDAVINAIPQFKAFSGLPFFVLNFFGYSPWGLRFYVRLIEATTLIKGLGAQKTAWEAHTQDDNMWHVHQHICYENACGLSRMYTDHFTTHTP